jgi:integrase
MALTDLECRNARCPEGRRYVRLADAGGLYLEVTATGSKLWRWKYRFAGREKRLALGAYPSVPLASRAERDGDGGTRSVKGARELRDDARKLLASGVDPGAVRKEQKRTARASAGKTFESVARLWWADWKADKTERHADYVLTRMEADAFPEIGHLPIAELTAPILVRMAKKIEGRGLAELPRRVLEVCGQVLRYAVAHGLAERNPAADVKPSDVLKPHKVRNHSRIGAAELPELIRKIAVYAGSPYTRMALQLMALTFVRTGELIAARWQEFDLDAAEWRIPAERMKKRRLHVVPLSPQALEVLGCLQALRGADRCRGPALLFPGERDHDAPMSNNTILYALYRMGYEGRMTGHGFRGLASTALHEMGYRPEVIEAQLAHVQANKIAAAYNHAQYLEERRQMMNTWADYLDAVKRSGAVIPFRQASRHKAAA